MSGFADRWNGSRFEASSDEGHYESWFMRANAATGERAFWIRYTIFSPRGRASAAVGELWAIVFDRTSHHHVAVKQVFPLDRCRFARDDLAVAVGDARLSSGALRGRAEAGGHAIGWDLQFAGGDRPLLLYPERLYRTKLPRAKVVVPHPRCTFTGSIDVDGTTLVIADWVGSQNHNWGSRHTDRYAWGQVAGFDEDPTAFLECSTARLRIGPVWTPWLSPLVLRADDSEFRLTSPLTAVRARGRYELGRWRIESSNRDARVIVHMTAPAEDFVALDYDNPPGGIKRCMNSKIARCEVIVHRPGRPPLTLHSTRAAFEILGDR